MSIATRQGSQYDSFVTDLAIPLPTIPMKRQIHFDYSGRDECRICLFLLGVGGGGGYGQLPISILCPSPGTLLLNQIV